MEYKNTYIVLEDYGIQITEEIMDLLSQRFNDRLGRGFVSNKIASGRLLNSIDFYVQANNDGLGLNITYAKHGTYVLRGRKAGKKIEKIREGRTKKDGTKGKDVKYDSYTNFPNIDAIEQWIREKKIPMNVEAGTVTKIGKGAPNLNSIAFLISRSIAKNGILPFNFLKPLSNVIESDEFIKNLYNALVEDGVEDVEEVIKKLNQTPLT